MELTTYKTLSSFFDEDHIQTEIYTGFQCFHVI